MQKFRRLLAKSSKVPDTPQRFETLEGHTDAAVNVSCFLVDRWGDRCLEALGLDPARFRSRLRLCLPRAALGHDLGKASDAFQAMLRSGKPVALPGRHECVSVWFLLRHPALARWLLEADDPLVRNAILVAILGHHLQIEDGRKVNLAQPTGALRLTILSGHPDFLATLRFGADALGLGDSPPLADCAIDLTEPQAFNEVVYPWLVDAGAWWDKLDQDEWHFVAALKALLVAADVAASAIPRQGREPVAWVQEALDEFPPSGTLERIALAPLNGSPLRQFQRDVSTGTARVTFVRAGCGSGKTTAAYLWAARRARNRKVFFCYPTTGTASQGFADYVPPDQFDAALVHSRALADLEDLLASGKSEDRDGREQIKRYEALATWEAPITVCTVDTVLGLIQNNRTGVFSLPSICNGAFVFDEIHQYDDRLFDALLRFLETFPTEPILLMTASLPRHRLELLSSTVQRLGEKLEVIPGPRVLEEIKRYRLEPATIDGVWHNVADTIAAGGRVLWVANTVDRAIDRARLADNWGFPVLPYHSRYRYVDRLKQHQRVVADFGKSGPPGGVLAVTTQVCEVSLDISADLLVTDIAPIAALIQRLGRLNRRVQPGQEVSAARALILDVDRPAPYETRELDQARRWLELLGPGAISQADLSLRFGEIVGEISGPRALLVSAWLDGGVKSAPASLRDDGTTISVVREEDWSDLKGLPPEQVRRELIRVSIPMPIGPVARELGGWRKERGVPVAPAGRIIYDRRFGGRWK